VGRGGEEGQGKGRKGKGREGRGRGRKGEGKGGRERNGHSNPPPSKKSGYGPETHRFYSVKTVK